MTMYYEEPEQAALRALGIAVDLGCQTFVIAESDPVWPEVERLMNQWGALDLTDTTFTQAELDAARLLRVRPSWHCGYPQPDDIHEYLKASYNFGEFCLTCSIGEIQRRPLRMKSAPRWGKRHLTQLHWVFDVYFARPEVWEEVFKPFGIECWPVIHHRSGMELDSVVQLMPQRVASRPLKLEGYRTETCSECGKTKWNVIARGFFPPFDGEEPGAHYFVSQEYFGSGGAASKSVFVSAELYAAIKEHKLKGVSFMPMAPE